jgi:hypothetical protein
MATGKDKKIPVGIAVTSNLKFVCVRALKGGLRAFFKLSDYAISSGIFLYFQITVASYSNIIF